MSRIISKTILVIFLVCGISNIQAQEWLGRTTGNYSGTYGVYHNASSISDSKYRYYFNFWGRGANFYNNFLTYNAPIKINRWANNNYDLQYQNANGKVDMKKDWLQETLNGKNKQFSFNQDIWGPAFMFPISRKWNMSVNTRQRSSFQMYGISEEVARMAHNGLDSSGGIYNGNNSLSRNTPYQNNAFGINIQSFQELSFTLGGILSRSEHHQLNGGLTIKFLRGLGASYMKGNNFNLTATGDNSAMINGDFQYANTDQKSIVTPFNDPYGLFSLRSKGAGAGFDLGVNYTYSSKRLKYQNIKGCNWNERRSDYDFKLALAINDIGGIRYNRNSTHYSYISTTDVSVSTPSSILNGFGSPNQSGFDTIGQKIFSQIGANTSNGFNTALPASFNMQADFRLSKHLYTGLYWNQSLKGFNSTGMRSTSMLSIIPRFESRGFEFSMPFTLSENYRNFYVGAYARIGPVFFGSDNLGGLFNVAAGGQFTGADIYGGVSFGIGHCPTRLFENKVDPVYLDSSKNDTVITEKKDTIEKLKRDTVRIILHDTIRIMKKDTVYILKNKKTNEVIRKDTIYIEKIIKSKADYEKEKELLRREEQLNKRQKDIELKEKVILEKEKGTYNESEAIKNCKNQNIIITDENVTLKNKINTQANEIISLKKQIAEQDKQKLIYDTTILALRKCSENKARTDAEILKLKNDILIANRRTTELELEIITLKKKNPNEPIKDNDALKLARAQKQLDSMNIVLNVLRGELESCKKNASLNTAEVVKKAEAEKVKAENDARVSKKYADSLAQVLLVKNSELESCKKNATLNSAEVVKKAETERAKAENDARISKKQNDSLKQVLLLKTTELENCKKNSTLNSAELVKKAENDKSKAENEARIAKKQNDSLSQVLVIKTAELENCKKNSTLHNAELIKKAESDKTKAENEAKAARKQADSLAQILTTKSNQLENCKKNEAQFDAEVLKNKKCADENSMLKAEMTDMSKNIGRLNTRNSALTYKTDSLINELKNCGKGNNNDDAELLKKCREANTELNAEVLRLKTIIQARDRSQDSMKNVAGNLEKKQVELNARISSLNIELDDMKTKAGNANCDELQKQLDEKNAENNKLKADAIVLQNKISSLNKQLSEQKIEYDFMVKQSQHCNQKLDSCIKGLYHTEPLDKKAPDDNGGNGSGSGGPSLGSLDSSSEEVYSSEEKLVKVLKTGGEIIQIIQKNSNINRTSRQSSSNPLETGDNRGNTNTGTNNNSVNNNSNSRPSEANSSNNKSTSGNNNDRNSGGSSTTTTNRR